MFNGVALVRSQYALNRCWIPEYLTQLAVLFLDQDVNRQKPVQEFPIWGLDQYCFAAINFAQQKLIS